MSIKNDGDQQHKTAIETIGTSAAQRLIVSSSSSSSSLSSMNDDDDGGSGSDKGANRTISINPIRINCTDRDEEITDTRKKLKTVLKSLTSILVYYFFSISLTFYNRYLFQKFKYPLSITIVHLIIKLVLATGVRFALTVYFKRKRVLIDWNTYVTRLLPTSMASACDIGLSNWSLQYITISLYTMSKSTVILFTFFFSIIFKLEKWVCYPFTKLKI